MPTEEQEADNKANQDAVQPQEQAKPNTVTGFGVFAFYTGHKITQEITFYISIPLFLAIPIAGLWIGYLFDSEDRSYRQKQTDNAQALCLLLFLADSCFAIHAF